MIIRPARIEDLENAIELLNEFHEESIKLFGTSIDKDAARNIITQFKDYALVVDDGSKIRGVIAGHVTIYPLDGAKIYNEAVWFVSKQYRSWGIRLLKALEKKCRDEWGIKYIVMARMINAYSEKIGAFYESIGYKPMEIQYIKTL